MLLAKPDIHQQWENAYRTIENEEFFDQVFDYITLVLNAPENSTFLDVGCGTCAHSIRLANRGFFVHAVDISESILKIAETNVKSKKMQHKISIRRQDVLSLSFEDETFNYILCWGVLMHIPNIEKAISELTRVLKPGGILIISEGNMYSLQSIILRNLKRVQKNKGVDVRETPAGLEHWIINSSSTLMTRHANMKWLIVRFRDNGFTVRKRCAGQFTELYTKVSSHYLKNLIQRFNRFWFNVIRIPQPAFGNILILEKS
jgi:ubiquinone/menaquinone biosynthesis C-methylase UbiE